jgi:hypothetical protein
MPEPSQDPPGYDLDADLGLGLVKRHQLSAMRKLSHP